MSGFVTRELSAFLFRERGDPETGLDVPQALAVGQLCGLGGLLAVWKRSKTRRPVTFKESRV